MASAEVKVEMHRLEFTRPDVAAPWLLALVSAGALLLGPMLWWFGGVG